MRPTIDRSPIGGLEECDELNDRPPDNTHGILKPQHGRRHFSLSRRAPAADLADHVERHWIVSWELDPGEEFVQEILPHPCVNLVAEPGRIAVWGIPQRRSPHRLEGTGIAVGTKFRPGGFRGFCELPAEGLNDRAVRLGELFGAAGTGLAVALAGHSGDPDPQITAIESFLRERLPSRDPQYELIAAVVAAMLTAPPATTVAELADRHAVSPRTLQRLFREYVGVGPKWVLKRYRMHEAAERIAAGEAGSGAELAFELGYSDQSHFISDFRSQIGLSPGAYARACAEAAGAEPVGTRQ